MQEVSQNFSRNRGLLCCEDLFDDTCVLLLWDQILLVASLLDIYLPSSTVQQSFSGLIHRIHYLWRYIWGAKTSLSFIFVFYNSLTRRRCMETFIAWTMMEMRKLMMAVNCDWTANQHLSSFDRKRGCVGQKEGLKLAIPLLCFQDTEMFDSISSECGQFSWSLL